MENLQLGISTCRKKYYFNFIEFRNSVTKQLNIVDKLFVYRTFSQRIHILVRNLSVKVCYHLVRCPQPFMIQYFSYFSFLFPFYTIFMLPSLVRYVLTESRRASVSYSYQFFHLRLHSITATVKLFQLEQDEVFGVSKLVTIIKFILFSVNIFFYHSSQYFSIF